MVATSYPDRMIARNITKAHMQSALSALNKKYEGNIVFRELIHIPEEGGWRFLLGTVDPKGPGGRRGKRRRDGSRRIVPSSACWHVHGHFFEALFKTQPQAMITSKLGHVTRLEGNWRDALVVGRDGDRYSDLCECRSTAQRRHRRAPIGRHSHLPMRPEGLLIRPLTDEEQR